MYNGSTKGQKITERFQGISKECIESYIKTLSEKEQAIFYKKYGKKLNELNSLTSAETATMNGIMAKLDRYFINMEKYKNFFANNNIDINSVRTNINLLADSTKETLFEMYGENLDRFNEDGRIIDLKLANNALMEIENRKYLFGDFKKDFAKTIEYYKGHSIESIKNAISELKTVDVQEILKIENSTYGSTEDLHYNVLNALKSKLGIILENDIYKEICYPKGKIDECIETLSDSDKVIVKKVMDKKVITRREHARYKEIINKIKNMLKTGKKKGTIYTLFNSYSKKEVDEAISKLSEFDRKKLVLRYGNDLENPVRDPNYTKEEGRYFSETIFHKLESFLKNPNIVVKPTTKVTVLTPAALAIAKKCKEQSAVVKEEPKKEVKKPKSVAELFSDIPIEDLKVIVSILPKQYRDVIYLKHTRELNEYNYFDHSNVVKYSKIYDDAIIRLDAAADVYKKGVKAFCNTDEEAFIESVDKLDENEKKLLQKVHGKNYDKSLPLCVLKGSDREKYSLIIAKLNKAEKHEEKVEETPVEVIKEPEIKEEIVVNKLEEPKVEEEQPQTLEVEEQKEESPNEKLKKDLLEKYGNIFLYSISKEGIEQIIDDAINKYDNDIDIERHILKYLYEYLYKLIDDNKYTLTRLYHGQ